jgi:hypothetical protein
MGSSKSDRNSLCVFSDVNDPLTCVFGFVGFPSNLRECTIDGTVRILVQSPRPGPFTCCWYAAATSHSRLGDPRRIDYNNLHVNYNENCLAR